MMIVITPSPTTIFNNINIPFQVDSPVQIKRAVKIVIIGSLGMVIGCQVEVDVWQEARE